MITHSEVIEFPNGKGFTPCSQEYRTLLNQMSLLKPDYISMYALSAEDYERWNKMDSKLAELQMSGHVGKSVIY